MVPGDAEPDLVACPTCGRPWAWRCRKCGSTEQRPKGKGCADCHRFATWQRSHPGASRAEYDDIRNAPDETPPPEPLLLLEPEEPEEPEDRDFPVTPAIRAYLAAFDAYLMARKARDTRMERFAETARRQLLAHLLDQRL